MVIEYARNIVGLKDANSAEFDEKTTNPVISTMADQHDVVAGERDMGGTMRLGLYPAKLKAGSTAARVYGSDHAEERHRHRRPPVADSQPHDRVLGGHRPVSTTRRHGHRLDVGDRDRDRL